MIDSPNHSASEGLEWVRAELITIFSEARTQLQKFADNQQDKAPLEQISSQLHTAHGALRMVEVYGAALLVEEMETLAETLATGDGGANEEGLEVLSRAIVQLPSYLDRVAGGGHDIPLVLLPLLNDMRAVRGSPLLSESSLFVLNVDKGAATPKRTPPPASIDYAVLAKKLRPHYQKSLLSWLRGEQAAANLNRLGNVCIKLETGAATTPVFQFWWVMGGVIEAIHDNGLAANAAVKRLLGKADQWLKKLTISGEAAFAEESPKNLLNNLLYYVARAQSDGKRVSAIKASFSLSELISPSATGDQNAPDALAAPSVELMKTVGAAIKQDVGRVKDAIDIFVRTNSTSHEQLVPPQESLKKLADTLGVLGLEELRQQTAVESRRLQSFIDEGRSGDEALLKIASTLIQVEAAIDEQLLGVIIPQGKPDDAPKSPEAAAAAADRKEVVSAVLRECVVNLTRVKETIAHFVDNPTNLSALDNVPGLIVGIIAGLNMLQKERAAKLLNRVEWHISAVTAEEDLARHTHELDRLADAIVSVEYYMETVRAGRSDPWYMLDNAERCLESIKRQPTDEQKIAIEQPKPVPEMPPAQPVVATQVIPGRTSVIDATGVQQTVNLSKPGTDAERRAAALAEPVAGLGGQRIDPELLELFIEEAKEEVAALRRAQPHWHQNLEEREVLLTMRRSFHTLKGSGRMVGAVLIGEYSWCIENLINKLISHDIKPSPGVVSTVDYAIEGLPALIEQLEVGTPIPATVETIMERAWQIVEAGREVTAPVVEQQPAETTEQDQVEDASLEPDQSPVSPEDIIAATTADTAMLKTLVAPSESELPDAELPTVEDPAALTSEYDMSAMFDTQQTPDAPAPEVTVVENDEPAVEDAPAAELDDDHEVFDPFGDFDDDDGDDDHIDDPELAAVEEPVADAPSTETSIETHTQVSDQDLPPLPEYLSDNIAHAVEDTSASSVVPGVVLEMQEPIPEVTETSLPVVGPAVELDPALHEIFLKESLEHLATIEEYVLAVQQQIEPFAVTEELHRAWHTLSGSANTAGVTPAAAIAIPLNQALRGALAESLPLSQEAVDVVHRSAMTFGEIVRGINHQPALPATDDLLSDIKRMPELIAAAKETVDALEGSGEQMPVNQFGPGYDPDIAAIFAEESTEILMQSEDALQGWFAQDDGSAQRMEELLRHLHTLKGGARMARIVPMGDLSHETESLLEHLRENQIKPTAEHKNVVRQSFDQLHAMTEQLAAGEQVQVASSLVASLRQAASAQLVEQPQPTQAAETNEVAPAVVTVDEIPAVDHQVAALASDGEALIDTGEAVQTMVRSASDADDRPVDKARIDAQLLDEMLNNAGEVSIFHSRLEQQVGSISFNLAEHQQTVLRLREQLRKLEIETEAQILHRHQEQGPRNEEFDPLELDRYSGLQQLSRALAESVSDLVSLQDLMSDIARESESLLVQQARVTGELQDALIRSRMLPFSHYRSRFERIVRQAAMEQGKEAVLTITGASGELDRQVLQRMLPPFEHMLRNAVIHGIESKAERNAAGKIQVGAISIDLKREGAEMVIRISDDGRGLDAEAILAKAQSLGLVDDKTPYSEVEAQNLIFRHGFSTAATITQSAGRGVGMDVVANEVKELGGSLQLASTVGQGTTVVVRLPLTLAVSQALLVRCADERFAIPLPAVEGVIRAPLSDVVECIERGQPYEHEDAHYSVRMLSPFLGASDVNLEAIDGPSVPLILVRVGERNCAMLVDELLGSREVVVKSAGPMVASIEGVAGATILGDGSIVVILDVASLVRNATDQRDSSEYVVAEASEDLRPVVLVVDDSITVRRVTQRLLERNGMRVLLAKDGVDAVAVMQEQVPDLVLLDIEMPRMDGYEVATHIRNTDELQHVPITMITSRVGEKHRARAFELGVDKYLGKPYQENQLLDVIHPMLERSIKQRS